MKKILIIIAIVILLLIVGVWVYLFMFGAPQNPSEIFARFGGSSNNAPEILPDTTIDVTGETENGALKNLRQLTIRPVAGAHFVDEKIRYVEQGTGHIYEIDLITGEETLINGTTIPQSITAEFSKGGEYVAITTYGTTNKTTALEEAVLNSNSTSTVNNVFLPLDASDIKFGNATKTLMYTLKQNDGTAGYTYDIEEHTSTQIFKSPLRDVRVLWGDPLYLYTTPTNTQEGYVYTLRSNNLTYVTKGGNGLTAIPFSDGIVSSIVGEEGKIVSVAHVGSNETYRVPLSLIPEKCAQDPSQDNMLLCAEPIEIPLNSFPDSWYKGAISFSDVLWSVDIYKEEAVALSNFQMESGRQIDVIKIGTDTTGEMIYFINKNDNTLWMFDRSI